MVLPEKQIQKIQGAIIGWPRLNKEGHLKYLKYFDCNKILKRGDQQISEGDS